MKKQLMPQIINAKILILLFCIWKVLDLISIFAASKILPAANFPYKDILAKFYLPHFITSFANFDGIQYITIAREGYYNFNQAFFPFYPILIKYLGYVLDYNYIISGLLISNIGFFFGLLILTKVLRNLKFSESHILWSLLFLIFFPTSFYFGSVYVTSFFFLLLVSFIYLMQKGSSLKNIFIGIMMGLTAINGILVTFSLIPVLVVKRKIDRKFIALLIGPVIGLSIYSVYLLQTKGDALYYLHSLSAFGVNRSTSLVLLPQVLFRYLKIFFTSNLNYQLFIAYLEFIIFGFGFILVLYFLYFIYKNRRDENYNILLFIGLFSLANILISTLTGTLTSTPRYVLYSLSIFMILPYILKNKYVKCLILLLFLIMHIILISFFTQGYFVS